MRFMPRVAREQEDAPRIQAAVPFEEKKDPWVVQKEVERMASRVERLGVSSDTVGMADELDDVEASIAAEAGSRLLGEILKTREELCKERGYQPHEMEECELFMKKACDPNANSTSSHALRKADQESSLSRPECSHFFMAKRTVIAAAPAAAPRGAPGPAVLGGKPEGPLPEQGFNEYANGLKVNHKDGKTFVDDWGKEFGPASGQRAFHEICREHPNNHWCRLHGYSHKKKKMMPKVFGAASSRGLGAMVAALALCAAALYVPA